MELKMSRTGRGVKLVVGVACFLLGSSWAGAQTPTAALLILEKSDSMLAIVDPATLRVTGRVAAGPDPHETVASPDGKFAYITNYGGGRSALHTISVVDL